MIKTTKSTKSTSPKFKVGDIVWIPFPAILDSEDSICFIQTTIFASKDECIAFLNEGLDEEL